MSLAGARSNRGDYFQSAIAFSWLLEMIERTDIAWIEIDATSLDRSGLPYAVDDIVVNTGSGPICCQCKKNETSFDSWTVDSLVDELKKAKAQLSRDPESRVRFYSHSPFGHLAKLAEYAAAQGDEAAYSLGLSAELRPTHQKLEKLPVDKARAVSVFEIMQRVRFITVEEIDDVVAQSEHRLSRAVTNAGAAAPALWSLINHASARRAGSGTAALGGRITREDAAAELRMAGSLLAGQVDETKAIERVTRISAIGRSWKRDAGGSRIPRSAVATILNAIDLGHKRIALASGPGVGKSCVMLDLLDQLETRPIVVLYMQCRVFADWSSPEERRETGLPDGLAEDLARLAESRPCVVLFDSLDVLSLSRNHEALGYFLRLMDQLSVVPHITVVAACRSFDLSYDQRLAAREWDCRVDLPNLDWESEVRPVLERLGIDEDSVPDETRALLGAPRMLAIFVDVVKRHGRAMVSTSEALTHEYLEVVIRRDENLGAIAIAALEDVAERMLFQRRLSLPKSQAVLAQPALDQLLSLNVLVPSGGGGRALTFGHQTLVDALCVAKSRRSGESLLDYIHRVPSVPFVRPTIRWYLRELRYEDPKEFRATARACMASNIAYHLKRLIAESLAEMEPEDDDWGLVLFLYRDHRGLFQSLHERAVSPEWQRFWTRHLVAVMVADQDVQAYSYYLHKMRDWKRSNPERAIEFYLESLAHSWLPKTQIADEIAFQLADMEAWRDDRLERLFQELLRHPTERFNSLGRALSKWVEANDTGDSVLWRYITRDVPIERNTAHKLDEKLSCEPHLFHSKSFLDERLAKSDELLSLAIASIEEWTSRWRDEKDAGYWKDLLLDETSYGEVHSRHDIRHVGALQVLLHGVEEAVLKRAKAAAFWWTTNRQRLMGHSDKALVYIAIRACTEAPDDNVEVIRSYLLAPGSLKSRLSFEIGSLISKSVWLLTDVDQATLEDRILALYRDEDPKYSDSFAKARASYLINIPAHLRSAAAVSELTSTEKRLGPITHQPEIRSAGGWVAPPVSSDQIMHLGDQGIAQLLRYYEHFPEDSPWSPGDSRLVGGRRDVGHQLGVAARNQPLRLLRVFDQEHIPAPFKWDVLEGLADHISYAKGHYAGDAALNALGDQEIGNLSIALLQRAWVLANDVPNERGLSRVLLAAAFGLAEPESIPRFTGIAQRLLESKDPDVREVESDDLVSKGINSVRGQAAEALVVVANKWAKMGREIPEAIKEMLFRYAADPHPAVRSTMLRRLPALLSYSPDLGWNLFAGLVKDTTSALWKVAEECLYYNYAKNWDAVKSFLSPMKDSGHVEGYGRLSALSALEDAERFNQLLIDLASLNDSDAWGGAAAVFATNAHLGQHRQMCIAGYEAAISRSPAPVTIAKHFQTVLNRSERPEPWPSDVFEKVLSAIAGAEPHARLHGVDSWLSALSAIDPGAAVRLANIWVSYTGRATEGLYSHEDVAKLLTTLFREGEERELSDGGEMLRATILLQDRLLEQNVWGLTDWLRKAERP